MNRNKIANRSTLFLNKLDRIVEQLQKDRTAIPVQTREAILAEATRLLSVFYTTVDSPGFIFQKVQPGDEPDIELYNQTFQQILDDLVILFTELETLEAVVIENFNLFTTQANRINSRVKKLASQVLDYSLYSKLPIKNSVFLSDTFSDTSKLEIASALLNKAECEVDQAQGIITLPVEAQVDLSINSVPSINSNSNGRAGNNEELFVLNKNAEIKVILDNNSDTWFEYERVLREDDGVPLVLDFTINLLEEEIINYIRINPNNFGSKIEIEILDIQTSVDGTIYKSIKDEISLGSVGLIDEPNVFILSPSTSKYSGQGVLSFTPRFAKYIKVGVRQGTPYPIQTVSGSQLRYAIGLRDIILSRIKYLPEGELVGATFQVSSEVKKIAIYSKQNLTSNDLGSIGHDISFDEGSSWNSIQPLDSDGLINIANLSAEVLNVNTDDTNSMKTESPATSVKWRTRLKRNELAFTSASSAFAEVVSEITELKAVPLAEPWTMNLNFNALSGSIGLLDLGFGSRGNEQFKYLVGTGIGSKVEFKLPFSDLRLDFEKDNDDYAQPINSARVFVNGEEWDLVTSFAESISTSKVFRLNSGPSYFASGARIGGDLIISEDSDNGLEGRPFESLPVDLSLYLTFGNGTTGAAPPANSTIEILLEPERLFFNQNRIAKLDFPTGSDRNTITVFKRGLIVNDVLELAPNAQIHKLPQTNILEDLGITFTDTSIFVTKKTFENGLLAPEGELEAAGDWSVDTERGIVYSFSRTDSDPGIISFFYQQQSALSTTDWDWGDTRPIHQSVQIKESAWKPNSNPGVIIDMGARIINLPHLCLVKGSLKFIGLESLTSTNNPFLKEVDFIDGNKEIQTAVKIAEAVPVLTPVGNIATFVTSTSMHSDTRYSVTFTDNEVFVTEKSSFVGLVSEGDYFADRSTSTVYVYTDGQTVEPDGDVNYFTLDPSKRVAGKYSVDYERGAIYLEREVPIEDIQISYSYTEYYIKYNIARILKAEDWVYNPATNTITINSSETLSRARIPTLSGTNSTRPNTYQVNYKYIAKVRKNIELLKEYFTPILKEYALQIVTSNLL